MKKLDKANQLIATYFSFLLEKGYKFVDGQYFDESFGNWMVTLASPDLKVQFRQDREYIYMSFCPKRESPQDTNEETFIDLGIIVAYINGKTGDYPNFPSGNGDIESQLSKLSTISRENYNQIHTLLASPNIATLKNELKVLAKELLEDRIKLEKTGTK